MFKMDKDKKHEQRCQARQEEKPNLHQCNICGRWMVNVLRHYKEVHTIDNTAFRKNAKVGDTVEEKKENKKAMKLAKLQVHLFGRHNCLQF